MSAFDIVAMKLLQIGGGLMDRYISGSGALSADFLDNPYPDYRRINARGPVVRAYRFGGWFVLGHDAVREAFLDPRFGVDIRKVPLIDGMVRRITGGEASFVDKPTMLNLDPPDHTRLRKLARQGFVRRYVDSLQPLIVELADECLASVQIGATFDLMDTLARPLPAWLIADILGVLRSDRPQFQAQSEYIAKYARTFEADKLRTASRVYDELLDYFAGITNSKRADPGDDMISRLLVSEDAGDGLSHDEVHRMCVLLLIAGHETTTRLLGNAVWILLSHPDQLARIRADRSLLLAAVNECLRLESPVQHTTRVALEDLDFHGARIRRHQLVELMIGAANRDPLVFDDPGRFDISRNPNPHLGFGYGVHLCLGAALAKLEVVTVLDLLLTRFPDLGLAAAPRWGDSNFVRGPEELLLSTA